MKICSIIVRLCVMINLLVITESLISRVTASSEEDQDRDGDTPSSSGGGIYWQDLSVTSKSSKKYILHPSSGFVRKGQLCGILGPSGSGKTTLLSALGGVVSQHAKLRLHGSVYYMEDSASSSTRTLSIQNGEIAWLQQHDAFFNMLTTRETLELAAFLEYPRLDREERDELVETSLDSLGLSSVQDRKIGNRHGSSASKHTSGLSGGEQRRLSVALELLSTPHLFLADEASTGLDSFQAARVVSLISSLARERHIPCILSLHQPRTSIWNTLDSIILMAPGGRMCYMGDREQAVSYFKQLGYPCPPATNPAEFLIDLVSIDTEDPRQARKDKERIDRIAEAFQKQNEAAVSALPTPTTRQQPKRSSSSLNIVGRGGPPPILWLRRWTALLRRSLLQNYRNHRVNFLRLAASAGNAVLFSQIFRSIRDNVPSAKSVADRVALLSFGVVNMSMMAIMKTIDLFAKERPVVDREQMRKQYSSLEYLLAKAIAELPLDTLFSAIFTAVLKATTGLRISFWHLTGTFSLLTVCCAALGFSIGSLTHSSDSSMALGMPVMVILLVVGIINPSGVDKEHASAPKIVEWIKMASPIRWAVEALCVAEYKGMSLENPDARLPWQKLRDLPKLGAFVMVKNGDQVLEALALEDRTYEGVMGRLAILSGMNLLISWMGLHFGGASFVKPTNNEESKANNNKGEREAGKSASRDSGSSSSSKVDGPIKVPVLRARR